MIPSRMFKSLLHLQFQWLVFKSNDFDINGGGLLPELTLMDCPSQSYLGKQPIEKGPIVGNEKIEELQTHPNSLAHSLCAKWASCITLAVPLGFVHIFGPRRIIYPLLCLERFSKGVAQRRRLCNRTTLVIPVQSRKY